MNRGQNRIGEDKKTGNSIDRTRLTELEGEKDIIERKGTL